MIGNIDKKLETSALDTSPHCHGKEVEINIFKYLTKQALIYHYSSTGKEQNMFRILICFS